MNNWALLTVDYQPLPDGVEIITTTSIPCHLWCYYTDKKPQIHPVTRRVRGVDLPWGAYYCFVAWKSVEQEEPGDTLTHTFNITPWLYCQSKWFTFRGTINGEISPSASPIFQFHNLFSPLTIFEYYIAAFDTGLYTSATVILAQTFTPQVLHQIAQLRLLLRRVGLPGIMTIEIQGTTPAGFPDDVTLTSGTFNADDLPTGPPPVAEWKTIDIDLYELEPGVTYAIVLYGGNDANRVGWNAHTSNPYPRGKACYWRPAPWFWFNAYGWDFLFQEYGYKTHIGEEITIEQRLTSLQDECRVWWDNTQWRFDFAHHETIPGYIVNDIYAAGYAMIFRNVKLPPKAQILSAILVCTTSGETVNPDIKTRIGTELNITPNPFSTIADYLARWRTPSPINWDDIEPWYTNEIYQSPSFEAQIQAVIDLDGWEAGKDIAIFWNDHADRSAHVDYTTRMADTFHHDPERSIILRIIYQNPS